MILSYQWERPPDHPALFREPITNLTETLAPPKASNRLDSLCSSDEAAATNPVVSQHPQAIPDIDDLMGGKVFVKVLGHEGPGSEDSSLRIVVMDIEHALQPGFFDDGVVVDLGDELCLAPGKNPAHGRDQTHVILGMMDVGNGGMVAVFLDHLPGLLDSALFVEVLFLVVAVVPDPDLAATSDGLDQARQRLARVGGATVCDEQHVGPGRRGEVRC